MKPYIFLTENYLKHTQDGNGNNVDILVIANTQVPYETTIFFTDKYGNIVNREIDTLILNNTNIINMTVSAANGLGVYSTVFTVSGNDQSSLILKNENAVTTSSLKFTIPDEGNPAQVSIGRLGVYGFVCNLLALTDSNYKIEANQGGFRTVDGSYIHWSDYKKWVAKVKMENVNKEQFDLLTGQADTGEMTVIPYQDLDVDAIYECAVGRNYSYGLNRKTELFDLELEFNEL